MQLGKTIGLAVLVLSLGLSMGTIVFADGGDATLIHACVLKDGTMRIVSASTACKSSETALHWATTARIVNDETRITNTETANTTQNSQISAIQTKNTQQDADIAALQGQSGGGGSGLVVKDGQGQVVGKWSGENTFRLVNNQMIKINAHPSGIFADTLFFRYTSPDCTGTRYMDSAQTFYEVLRTVDNQTGYYGSGPIQNLFVHSIEFYDSEGVAQCETLSFPDAPVRVATAINILSLGTPPFRLE